MQYETVLGPETDEPLPRTASKGSNNAAGDAEKGYSGPTADISGPGLGDLHTIDPGNTQDVSRDHHLPFFRGIELTVSRCTI